MMNEKTVSHLQRRLGRRATRPRWRPRRRLASRLLLVRRRPRLCRPRPRPRRRALARSPRHGMRSIRAPRRYAHDARHRDAPRKGAHRRREITPSQPSSHVGDDRPERERRLRRAFGRALTFEIHPSPRRALTWASRRVAARRTNERATRRVVDVRRVNGIIVRLTRRQRRTRRDGTRRNGTIEGEEKEAFGRRPRAVPPPFFRGSIRSRASACGDFISFITFD